MDPVRNLAGINLSPRIHREISSSLNSLIRELLLLGHDESFVSSCFVDRIDIVIGYSQRVRATLSSMYSNLGDWLRNH